VNASTPCPASRAVSGLVLAGGRSRRMGVDKALLEVAGQPLWQRQRDLLLAAGVEDVLISARPDQGWSAGLPVVHDAAPDHSPLGGIVAGLGAARADRLFVLAVDLPRLSPSWLEELWAAATVAGGAVGRWPEGHFEPLAALYPRGVLAEFSAALAARRLALQPLLAQAVAHGHLRVIPLTAARRDDFTNWNEPTTFK
jgi:molybdopterin-guanine dinucleotide biosynthesis protein A